jgi:hypothetical protein
VGVWAGEDSPSKRDRQPSLFAYALRARREATALPLNRGNKKAQRHPHDHEQGPTAPAVDSSVDCVKTQKSRQSTA